MPINILQLFGMLSRRSEDRGSAAIGRSSAEDHANPRT